MRKRLQLKREYHAFKGAINQYFEVSSHHIKFSSNISYFIMQEQIFSVDCGPGSSCFRAVQFQTTKPRKGNVWEKIAQDLNAIEKPTFRFTARAVRNRYSLLITKHAQKLWKEEKALGIEVETSELDIIERKKNV